MKTTLRTLALILAFSLPATAQQAVSARTALASGSLDPALDILPIVDISAGLSGSKKITIDDLFAGWGITAAGETLAKAADAAAQRTALGFTAAGSAIATAANATAQRTSLGITGNIYNLSHGTAAGNLVRLDATTGKLPAVDGSLLTNLPTNLPAGGTTLVSWAEAVTSATPNASTPAVSWSVVNAATNADAIIQPKGNAAILAQIPDGTTTGGDKRGIYATDWQRLRTASTMVASGTYSTIGGGRYNTASGSYSTVAGGTTNAATGTYTFIGGGIANAASGNFSTASGYAAITRSLYGMDARASGRFSVDGDAQAGTYTLRGATTNATITEITMDGGAASSTTTIVLPNNSTYSFQGLASARASGGDAKAWRFSGTIERGAAAANTAIIGTVTSTSDGEAGASAWALTIDADTTNGTLRFQGTGAAATNIRWLVKVETCELNY